MLGHREKRSPGAGDTGARRTGNRREAVSVREDKQLDHARQAETVIIDWTPSLASVHRGRSCFGHTLRTARGFLVLDAQDCVLGIFASREAARHALATGRAA
jgi:hypothetical protein